MRFSGYGPGKRGGPKLRYNLATGEVKDASAPPKEKKRGPAFHHRFKPFVTYQYTKDAAKRMGSHRDAEGATHVTSEAQLNRYLAFEKSQGRKVYWREH